MDSVKNLAKGINFYLNQSRSRTRISGSERESSSSQHNSIKIQPISTLNTECRRRRNLIQTFSPCANMSALKSRNSASWSFALWVTAVILVAVLHNVEGLTRCYICFYLQDKNGRSNGGNSSFEGITEKFRGLQFEGRQAGDGDPSCVSGTTKTTGLCKNGCRYGRYESANSIVYSRRCAEFVKPDSCDLEGYARECFCSTNLSNNGTSFSGNNRVSPSNGLYTAIVAIGAFNFNVVLKFLKDLTVNR